MANIKPYFTYGVSASDRDLITSTTTYLGSQKRYFSSLDAEIYVGDKRIEDIVRIDFSYEEKKLPYYGFNSFTPSRLFVGQKLVQGTFAINFTEAGYIAKLLQKIEASDSASKYDLIGQACSETNAPLFDKQFDILVGYGGYKNKEASLNNTYLVIQAASINGYQQILDTSGEPVMEVYSFIAKAIKFDGFKYPKKNEEQIIKEENSDKKENKKWELQVAEKRNDNEVKELQQRCHDDNKLLGFVYDISHSKHKQGKLSHLYVTVDQLNMNKDNQLTKQDIILQISDNEVDITHDFYLKKTEGMSNHYGAVVSVEDTEKIVKKLSKGTQKFISCSIKLPYILNGAVQTPKTLKGCIRRGLNY